HYQVVVKEHGDIAKWELHVVLLYPHPPLKCAAKQAGLISESGALVGRYGFGRSVLVLLVQPVVQVGAVMVFQVSGHMADAAMHNRMLIDLHVGETATARAPDPDQGMLYRQWTGHEP